MVTETVSLYLLRIEEKNNLYELFYGFRSVDDMEKVSKVTNIPITRKGASLLLITTSDSENLPENRRWYNVPLSEISKLDEHVIYTNDPELLFQLK